MHTVGTWGRVPVCLWICTHKMAPESTRARGYCETYHSQYIASHGDLLGTGPIQGHPEVTYCIILMPFR